ncbi:hypothetical protein Tco_1515471 [Tanacetum coccineum]
MPFHSFIMSTPVNTSSTDSQMHNNIMAAGSKDRPPMLGPGRYSQWRSRFLRYIDTKPNGEGLRKSILSGPYVPSTVLVQAVAATEGDKTISTVDACKTSNEMWIAIKRLQLGESLNIQDVKTNLFWEFRKFTSRDGGVNIVQSGSRNKTGTHALTARYLCTMQRNAVSQSVLKTTRITRKDDEFKQAEQGIRKHITVSWQRIQEVLPERIHSTEHHRNRYNNEGKITCFPMKDKHLRQILAEWLMNVLALANLIANLTLDTRNNKTISKQLKIAKRPSLTQELEECKTNLDETSKALGEATSCRDLKAQMQDKNIAISELKKLIEKCKGKSVETQFDKPSVVASNYLLNGF